MTLRQWEAEEAKREMFPDTVYGDEKYFASDEEDEDDPDEDEDEDENGEYEDIDDGGE